MYSIKNILIALLIVFLPSGQAMAFFDKMKVNLFSDVKGTVTLHGQAVEGALIKRLAIPNNDKEYTDTVLTDASGHFSFPRMQTSSFLKLFPGQSTVYQKITITYKTIDYIAWETGGADDIYHGELNELELIGTDAQRDINLSCELTEPNTYKAGAYTTVISGICTWEGNQFLD